MKKNSWCLLFFGQLMRFNQFKVLSKLERNQRYFLIQLNESTFSQNTVFSQVMSLSHWHWYSLNSPQKPNKPGIFLDASWSAVVNTACTKAIAKKIQKSKSCLVDKNVAESESFSSILSFRCSDRWKWNAFNCRYLRNVARYRGHCFRKTIISTCWKYQSFAICKQMILIP